MLKSYLFTPSAPSTPYDRIVNTAGILYSLLWICSGASLAIGLIYGFYHRFDGTAISLMGLTAVSLVMLFFYKRGYFHLSGLILFISVSLVLTFNISIGNAIFDEAMIAYPLIIVFTGLLFGKRSVAWVTGITLAELLLVFILAQFGVVTPFNGALAMRGEETITTGVILLATGLMLWVVVDIIEDSVHQIQDSEIKMENTYELTLKAWAKALELRGREIPGHSQRVTSAVEHLAEYLGYDELAAKGFRHGALLHDIGKMGIPEYILLKPGSLTSAEWEVVKNHPKLAAEIFKDIPYLQSALDVVRYHHERFDGGGYPFQLGGDEIPETAQYFSMIDSWDVLRFDRPYSPAMDREEVLSFLAREAGNSFHPDLLEKFLGFIDSYASADVEEDQ